MADPRQKLYPERIVLPMSTEQRQTWSAIAERAGVPLTAWIRVAADALAAGAPAVARRRKRA